MSVLAGSAALARLNGLAPADAERELLDCCGARRWTRRMAASRPFASATEAAAAAERAFDELEAGDWLEAFAAHPRIGGAAADGGQSARGERWSEREQAAARRSGSENGELRTALAAGNERYERRFGYTYVVCASGRTAPEMLVLLEERLAHDPAFELGVAAAEQRRITQLRLERMLGR